MEVFTLDCGSLIITEFKQIQKLIRQNFNNNNNSFLCLSSSTHHKFSSVHLFAFMNFNFINYNDNHVFGRQSWKLFRSFKGLP